MIATHITTVSLTPTSIVAGLTVAATREGLDGKTVTFSFPNSLDDPASVGQCKAVTMTRTPPTDPSTNAEPGWAECQLEPTVVLAASFKRIAASFAGDKWASPRSVEDCW